MGYVPTALAEHGTKLQVELLGHFYYAEVTAKALYDPDGTKMRS